MLSRPQRTVLLIAFHYPPCAVSSGVQRTLAFSAHLQAHGWHPVVLSAAPYAYERTSSGQLVDIPANVPVYRTTALDTARHLSWRGRYWSRLALPDRWASWSLSAVPVGLYAILRHKIAAIWSTYPLATAHRIGGTLARLSGRPWIADFRDPMVETFAATGEVFPADPVLRRARLQVEANAVRHASRLVFCTNSARDIVAGRYPHCTREHTSVIANGYNDELFRSAAASTSTTRPDARRVLLHSGTIYPGSDRDPRPLLQAIRSLAELGVLSPDTFELRLRDPSNPERYRAMAHELGIAQLVSILPPLTYREALAEMLQADGLLLLQGYTSNPAIPAKLYEYLRAGRPIVGLVHPDGESAATLRAAGVETRAPLDDVPAITGVLSDWVSNKGRRSLPDPRMVEEYSRERLTGRLADLLDTVAKSAGSRT